MFQIRGKNLISIMNLGGEGCVTTFINKTSKVTKGSVVIERGENVGNFYLWNCISNFSNDLTSTREDA